MVRTREADAVALAAAIDRFQIEMSDFLRGARRALDDSLDAAFDNERRRRREHEDALAKQRGLATAFYNCLSTPQADCSGLASALADADAQVATAARRLERAQASMVELKSAIREFERGASIIGPHLGLGSRVGAACRDYARRIRDYLDATGLGANVGTLKWGLDLAILAVGLASQSPPIVADPLTAASAHATGSSAMREWIEMAELPLEQRIEHYNAELKRSLNVQQTTSLDVEKRRP